MSSPYRHNRPRTPGVVLFLTASLLLSAVGCTRDDSSGGNTSISTGKEVLVRVPAPVMMDQQAHPTTTQGDGVVLYSLISGALSRDSNGNATGYTLMHLAPDPTYVGTFDDSDPAVPKLNAPAVGMLGPSQTGDTADVYVDLALHCTGQALDLQMNVTDTARGDGIAEDALVYRVENSFTCLNDGTPPTAEEFDSVLAGLYAASLVI